MHPAPSLLVFTTASGAGYGLLFLLGLAAPLGLVPPGRGFALAGLGLAFALIVGGLLASTFHLKHPERAWRALGQWRSSWLSREGVAALATFAPAGAFAVGWIGSGSLDGMWTPFGPLAAAGAAATVVCTGNIYASLKPVRAWHHPLVVPVYLAFALATGGLWLTLALFIFGAGAPWAPGLTLAALALAWGLKARYWRGLARPAAAPTAESATGLEGPGRVRVLEPPHTEENYLLNEMGYRLARKHARRLRRLAVLLGAALPAAGLIVALALGGAPAVVAAGFALLCGLLGVVIERWLFFAEASHTVMLYYGAGPGTVDRGAGRSA